MGRQAGRYVDRETDRQTDRHDMIGAFCSVCKYVLKMGYKEVG
jgi:hypothetical protein